MGIEKTDELYMAHYRKIDVRIWNDEKFHRLTTHGKLAFLYLVTHPNMTNLGAMRATAESLSDELEVLPEAFAEAFKEGLAEADPKAKCILVKNFVKYQSAESPNVIKSWAKQLDFIPECGLKVQAIQYVKDYVEGLGEAFKEAFAKAFPESLSTKHLTLNKKEEPPKVPKEDKPSPPTESPLDFIWTVGTQILGDKARSIIGKARKSVGDERVTQVLAQMASMKPPVSDPLPYFIKATTPKERGLVL